MWIWIKNKSDESKINLKWNFSIGQINCNRKKVVKINTFQKNYLLKHKKKKRLNKNEWSFQHSTKKISNINLTLCEITIFSKNIVSVTKSSKYLSNYKISQVISCKKISMW